MDIESRHRPTQPSYMMPMLGCNFLPLILIITFKIV